MAKRSRSNWSQTVIPGAGDVSSGTMAQRRANQPMLPNQPQRPCDIGLFSDEADQLDLVEMLQDPVDDD